MKKLSKALVFFWLVSWTASRHEPKPCAEVITFDPYTGSSSTVAPSSAVLCGEDTISNFERRFDSEKEARGFAAGCPKGTCADVSVKEVAE